MEQSAIDANCHKDDFKRNDHVIVASAKHPGARKYLEWPLPCNLISYGTNIVASIHMDYKEIVEAYIHRYPMEHCFETRNRMWVRIKDFKSAGFQRFIYASMVQCLMRAQKGTGCPGCWGIPAGEAGGIGGLLSGLRPDVADWRRCFCRKNGKRVLLQL